MNPQIVGTTDSDYELARDSNRAGLLYARLDIVVYAEEISRIVFRLNGGQAREIRTERCVDNLFNLKVERGKKMRVRGVRAKHLFAGTGPVAVDRRLSRIGPLGDKQNVPGKFAVRVRRGIVANPAGGPAVEFNN